MIEFIAKPRLGFPLDFTAVIMFCSLSNNCLEEKREGVVSGTVVVDNQV